MTHHFDSHNANVAIQCLQSKYYFGFFLSTFQSFKMLQLLSFVVTSVHTQPGVVACQPGFDHFPFCNSSMPLAERVHDLVARIKDEVCFAVHVVVRHGVACIHSTHAAIAPVYIPLMLQLHLRQDG